MKQRVWAVAYVVWIGSHGPGGTGAVVESYVWDEGRTRLAGREDSDFSGYGLKLDWVTSVPYQVGLLAHGRLSGSNGLGWSKAIVYFCDPHGVHAVWQSPTLLGLTAVARGELIALRHAQPCERAASSACAWTYEVYVLGDWASEHPTVTLVSRETRRAF